MIPAAWWPPFHGWRRPAVLPADEQRSDAPFDPRRGSTGVSLAQACAAKGYALHVVTSDAFSIEKRRHMRALGAELTIVPSDAGAMDESLTRRMIEEARRIASETGAFWTDQLNNRDQVAGYRAMGEETWTQTGGRIDAFVQSVGTAGSITGANVLAAIDVARRLGPDATVVTIACDSGLMYLSTPLYGRR